jgi:hypothetical protein
MDFKDQMIEAVERGWSSEEGAYDFVRSSWAGGADDLYKRMKEEGYRNPLVADMFCTTCHTTENGHPNERCSTGFIPGDPEDVRNQNRARGFPS